MLTAEQLERLDALCESSGFSPDAQVGALIDLDYEEWQDAVAPDAPSKSTRFARFVALDGS
ncbi:MAG: hypothetical protein ABW061_11700, partial [Polyangiaceae bacterium]